jgi:hypothetical protein
VTARIFEKPGGAPPTITNDNPAPYAGTAEQGQVLSLSVKTLKTPFAKPSVSRNALIHPVRGKNLHRAINAIWPTERLKI